MPALRLTSKTVFRLGEQPATTLPISPEKHCCFAAMAASIFLSSILWCGAVPTALAIPV